ncbi:MAG TPA: NAD-dependent epimerase/dehydratase family protein [Dehalococcoidia bacterium]
MADNGPCILVTGASGYVGRRLVARLAGRGLPVRALVRARPDAAELQATGAQAVTGSVLDPKAARRAVEGAVAVVHLVGALIAPPARYEAVNYGSVAALLEAVAATGGSPRLIFLSFPGASAGATNPYLRAKGRAEDAIVASGLPYVILRSAHIYGPDAAFLHALVDAVSRRRALVIGGGKQRMQPVYVDDVVETLAGAVARPDLARQTLEIGGPDTLPYEVLLSLVAGRLGRPFRPLRVPLPLLGVLAAFLERASPEPSLTRAALDVLARDCLVDPSVARSIFDLRLTPFREGLERSLPGLARRRSG